MYRVDLYNDGQKADLFQDESIEMSLSVQNISDISKVFGDYSQSFSVPASVSNNAIFKHYYNVDISGSFDALVRIDAFIEINNNVYKNGTLELESVQMKGGEPYAYQVGFYSKVTSLKDSFGEDQLNDLDLSAYDHDYNDINIQTGLNSYVAGTSSSIIYPLISPSDRWYYNSQQTGHETEDNIAYHSGGHGHGVHYYDLKPAIKLKAIVDAIESKYGIEFQSDFFDSADFGKLFMWCHRRAGYMFKDQPNGFPAQIINFTTNSTGDYNLTTQKYTITAAQETTLRVTYTLNSTATYNIDVYVNDEPYTTRQHTGNVSGEIIQLGTLDVGDTIQFRFSPPADWDASAISINTATFDLEYFYLSSWNTADVVGRLASQSIVQEVLVADQMPEQKVSEFIASLIKAFNLVVVPVANGKYDVEPLDVWLSEGTTTDITEYVNTEDITIKKPSMYRRINFSYNETKAVLGEEFRLQNYVGYGDLRADFNFDGDEFDIKVGFDNMLFERLTDQDTGNLTDVNVGSSITRELKPYIGQPFIFYASGNIRSSDLISYVDMTGADSSFTDFWLVGNTNADSPTSVTKTINFGTEVDPYHLQAFNTGLYNSYWKDYITDLYSTSRRVFSFKAQLPLGLMLDLKLNDKLTISERNYIINQLSLNLTTGEATLELLNEV